MSEVVSGGLALLLIALAIWTVVAREAFLAIAGFVAYGLLLALVWVRLAGIDVALTEVAIGGGLTGVLLIGAGMSFHNLRALGDPRALAPSEAELPAVRERMQRRFGSTGLGDTLVVGTAADLTGHVAQLHDRGVERFYMWFADFAPVETLHRFAEVIASVGSGS